MTKTATGNKNQSALARKVSSTQTKKTSTVTQSASSGIKGGASKDDKVADGEKGKSDVSIPTTRAGSSTQAEVATAISSNKRKADDTLATESDNQLPKNVPRSAKKAKVVPELAPAKFSGSFDLYAARLAFLLKVYRPPGTTGPQYEALYNEVLKYQAKNDRSGKAYLPASQFSAGKIEIGMVCNPFLDEPYDLQLDDFSPESQLTFTSEEREDFKAAGPSPPEPGVSAEVSLAEDMCGVDSAMGEFKMTRVWTQQVESEDGTGELRELFEGWFICDVELGLLLSRKGFDKSTTYTMPFWAVRARKGKLDEEIGPGSEDDY